MKKLSISQVDTIFVNGIYPIEFLLYYRNTVKTKTIRSSLAKLSTAFWPIFGKYLAGEIQFEKYSESDCFNEHVIDQKFDRYETTTTIYETYCRINPCAMKKLFFLTVIQHKNGTLLIPKMNHLAGDGYSYFYFLSTLAALCQSTYIPFKKYLLRALYQPHHQRTILKPFRLSKMKQEVLSHDEKFLIEIIRIPKAEVRKEITRAVSELNQKVSSNDFLSAMAIKKLISIQTALSGKTFQLNIPIDVRGQIKEYGSRYFGNGLMFKVINFNSNELEKTSVSEIAVEIRKSMPVVTKESYADYLNHIETLIANGLIDKLKPFDPDMGCLVTNLSRLPASRLNFGTGNPDFIFPLTIEKNSAAILSDYDHFILRYVY